MSATPCPRFKPWQVREKEAFACAEAIGVEGKMFGFGAGPLLMTPERKRWRTSSPT